MLDIAHQTTIGGWVSLKALYHYVNQSMFPVFHHRGGVHKHPLALDLILSWW
jgi:hypothetical protein